MFSYNTSKKKMTKKYETEGSNRDPLLETLFGGTSTNKTLTPFVIAKQPIFSNICRALFFTLHLKISRPEGGRPSRTIGTYNPLGRVKFIIN